MDDEPQPQKHYPLSTSKMSKTPSWIMLGFLLGAVFVAALPPRNKRVPEAAVFRAVEPPKPREPRSPPQLTTIEAVFAEWGRYAVWSDDATEVALWNTEDRGFTEFYEVRRFGDAYYFRSIPRLTRRIIAHGKPIPESPLQFTETEEQYREWQTYGRVERTVEREPLARPRSSTPAPAPTPVDRSVDLVAPAIPPPEFTPGRSQTKERAP
jgi:hypothetical protein